MIKKSQKYDYIFIITMLISMAYYFVLIFQSFYLDDEVFYSIVPLRLINGDSLIQHEWHLTQFSALFQYLPVKIWLLLKGSTDGIILYLRCLYLFVHTVISILVYNFFRKSGFWAVIASIMFYVHLPYGIFALSYASMFMIFWLLFVLSLISIQAKGSPILFVLAGFWFGCSCVCSPTICILFFIYFVFFLLWPYKEKINLKILQYKPNKANKKSNSKKSSNTEVCFSNNVLNIFFTPKAFAYIFCGISIIAVIAISFFFATGGTISSIFKNISNIFTCSEYTQFFNDNLEKPIYFLKTYNELSLKLPFLLPIFFIVIKYDKNRNIFSHRIMYLFGSFILSIVYMLGITLHFEPLNSINSLPFCIVSITCYILTKNKNKLLFYLLWCPCISAGLLQAFFSNTIFLSFNIGIAISNIAGVFFLSDLYKEMAPDSIKSNKEYSSLLKKKTIAIKNILLIAICLQLFFQCFISAQWKLSTEDVSHIANGPFAGLYMKNSEYPHYDATLKDIEKVKSIVGENEPVLIITYNLWTYLHIDRPFAIHTVWRSWRTYPEHLKLYYKSNPDRIPSYIYLSSENDYEYDHFDEIETLFDFTEIKLSDSILLKVNAYHPD